jgi:hypothetical protein
VYFIGREVVSREAGIVAVALTALIPSLHLFGPYPDQLFPLFAIGALYAWQRALRVGSAVWAAAAGVALVIGLLWSLSLLAAAAAIAGWSILTAWNAWRAGDGPSRRAWLKSFSGLAAGILVASLLPMALLGYDTWQVWKICLSQHATFAVLFPRSYGSWTLFNPVEFAVFVGLPSFTLWAVAAGLDLDGWRQRKRADIVSLPAWTLFGVLFALNLSGKNLGEVARLWMFLMPLAALAGAGVLAGLDRRSGWLAGLVLVLGTTQLIVFRLSLNVMIPS